MPLAIVRPDAVAVPALARVLITGECIYITRDGNGAFLARIVEVLRKEALDDATRREWFPPREPRMWAPRGWQEHSGRDRVRGRVFIRSLFCCFLDLSSFYAIYPCRGNKPG